MKKAVVLSLYFAASYIVLVGLILFSLAHLTQNNKQYLYSAHSSEDVYYKALPEINEELEMTTDATERRVEVLEEMFARYHSPLSGHGEKVVGEADKHSIDYRLLPAIAMKESTLCKKIPKDSYNCYGYGIYGSKVTRFSSFDEGIEVVTKSLAKSYIGQGLTDPEAIMAKYNPVSEGSWADTVNLVMNRLNEAF